VFISASLLFLSTVGAYGYYGYPSCSTCSYFHCCFKIPFTTSILPVTPCEWLCFLGIVCDTFVCCVCVGWIDCTSSTCYNHGTCNSNGACVCNSGFGGQYCNKCASYYACYPNCQCTYSALPAIYIFPSPPFLPSRLPLSLSRSRSFARPRWSLAHF
jgi:hypothetical protein